MPKFKTRPQTPKEELLRGEFPSPKVASPPKKAPSASISPPKPGEPQKGKRGCGMGIGGCALGGCLGIFLALLIIVGGIIFAGQSLLKNLSPELRKQLSTQEGVIQFLESLQSKETSPSASPSARPQYFQFEVTP